MSIIWPSLLFPQSQNLPLDHWAYSFLDRLQTKGLLVIREFDTRPYSREAIADMIAQIDKRVTEAPSLLSSTEWQRYEQLKGEFFEDLEKAGHSVSIQEDEHEPHLFTWREEDSILRWDALFGQQVRLESKQKVDPTIPKASTYWGGSFRADIKQSLAIYAEARSFFLSDADSLANTVFNPSLGLPVTRKALVDVAVTDNASAYAVVRLPWFDFEAGRDLAEWGPGHRGNLILSRNSNFYDLLKLTFRFNQFKFEHLHSFLNSDSTKFLAGHRLEIRPSRSFQFAFSETVVYGNRSVEFLYLNPFVPMIISERHLGDQDNNMLGFDFSWFVYNQGIKIYGEILFDDFSFSKDLFGSFGNKWGVLLGTHWVNPFGLQDTDFRVELARLQPFVYSHKFPVNTYSNYNNGIGHWLGPDADNWYFEIKRRLHRDFEVGVAWEQRRRGQNDITFNTRPGDGKTQFLGGTVERNRFYSLLAEWQVWRDLFVNINYQFIQSQNLRRVKGANQDNHRLLLNLTFNY